MVTQKEVRKLFDYDKSAGSLIRKTDVRQCRKGDIAGTITNKKYYCISINFKRYQTHRLVWLWHYGYFPENYIDHINRNTFDNKIENLREASNQCNMRNTNNWASNRSGVKGVCWYTQPKRWVAQVYVFGKKHILGYFKDFDEAVYHRLAAEQCLNWSSCGKGSPASKYIKHRLVCST